MTFKDKIKGLILTWLFGIIILILETIIYVFVANGVQGLINGVIRGLHGGAYWEIALGIGGVLNYVLGLGLYPLIIGYICYRIVIFWRKRDEQE